MDSSVRDCLRRICRELAELKPRFQNFIAGERKRTVDFERLLYARCAEYPQKICIAELDPNQRSAM